MIPRVVKRFGVDPQRIAIGGISMGGFGAFDIALHHPGMFCAVGGHSPALWFEGGETAPGAFDDAADFEANDVVGTVQEDPEAFGDARVWIDYGTEDPSASTTKASSKRWKRGAPTSPPTHGRAPTRAATGTTTGPTTSASTSRRWRTAAGSRRRSSQPTLARRLRQTFKGLCFAVAADACRLAFAFGRVPFCLAARIDGAAVASAFPRRDDEGLRCGQLDRTHDRFLWGSHGFE